MVKSHAGNKGNEKADLFAKKAATRKLETLDKIPKGNDWRKNDYQMETKHVLYKRILPNS